MSNDQQEQAPPAGGAVSRARLEPLQPRALSQRIVDSLKRVIMSGEMKPGDRVLETDLADRLGVSRGPVREAFRQLEQEGLLVSYPHRGTFVTSIPEDEIEEVYALRGHLEAYAARRVASDRADDATRALQPLLDAMRVASQAGDIAMLAEKDLEFHDTLLQLSGLRALHRIWRSMDGLVRARVYTALGTPTPEAIVNAARSHQEILDAIVAGDADRAGRAAAKHVESAQSVLRRAASASRGDPGGEGSEAHANGLH
ncbi:MAG: GntR family transcriptional regulator [Chloroflexota bacterium]